MNTRVNDIVDSLLDLNEDLNSKMTLLTQQFTEYPEEQIRQMAEADPTSPERAEYVTWLLRLRRAGAWDGSAAPVRDLLTRFDEIKRAKFRGWEGQKDINQFKSVEELDAAIKANPNAGSRAAEAKSGAQAISRAGDLTLMKLTAPEACRKFAIGHGQVTSPEATWCTIAIETARDYLTAGPAYVVLKAGHPYVQVHFGRPQAKTTRNSDISVEQAKEIAPLFAGGEFDRYWNEFQFRPTGWVVNDSHIEKQLLRLIKRWYSEKLEGHAHPRTGDWVPPSAKTPQEARETLRAQLPRFFKLFAESVSNQDEAVIRQIGERHGSPGGLQALFNAVYELKNPQAVTLPPLLQNFEALQQAFETLADQYEKEKYKTRGGVAQGPAIQGQVGPARPA